MTRKMIINAVDPEEIRIAILDEHGKLQDLDIETRGVEKNKGNIYKGTVKAVEPALNAAFVDYGADKEGFISAGDVDPKAVGKSNGQKHYGIAELLKPRQSILVQVEKDEVGTKGAVLTTYLSLAGRYVVLMPGENRQGISRRIEDEETRGRIREATSRLDVPEGMGVIIRTAGSDRTKADLNRDLKVLLRLWDNIQKQAAASKGPALILKEQDVIIRALRDYFSSDVNEIVVDSDEAYDRAAEYMHLVMPKQRSMLTRYVERRPIFHHYRVEQQLEALYASKVALPSGGSIVIEPTEALVSVDVNSGKQKSARHEETAVKTNLDAAEEIARQLRLRDLGGIVVIDFIDMISARNRQLVEKAVKEALKPDKARVRVGRISGNGTLELTRQRLRSALEASVFHTCEVCSGTGQVLNPESHAISVLRRLRDRASRGDLLSAKIRIEREAATHLRTVKWGDVQEIVRMYDVRIEIIPEPAFVPGKDDLTFEADPKAKVAPQPEPDFGPPQLEEEPDELYELEEEEEEMTDRPELGMQPGQEGERRGGKRRRRRRGAKPIGAAAASEAARGEEELGELGLPTVEMLDLETYRKLQAAEAARTAATEARAARAAEARTARATQARAARAPEARDARREAGEDRREREEGAEGRPASRRRRSRRGGARRRGEGQPQGAEAFPAPRTPAPEAAPAPAVEAKPSRGVGGFLKRLFGGK